MKKVIFLINKINYNTECVFSKTVYSCGEMNIYFLQKNIIKMNSS